PHGSTASSPRTPAPPAPGRSRTPASPSVRPPRRREPRRTPRLCLDHGESTLLALLLESHLLCCRILTAGTGAGERVNGGMTGRGAGLGEQEGGAGVEAGVGTPRMRPAWPRFTTGEGGSWRKRVGECPSAGSARRIL